MAGRVAAPQGLVPADFTAFGGTGCGAAATAVAIDDAARRLRLGTSERALVIAGDTAGATAIVLERLDQAVLRRHEPLLLITGVGFRANPGRRGAESTDALARCCRDGLARARRWPGDVARVSIGTGCESVLREVFGADLARVSIDTVTLDERVAGEQRLLSMLTRAVGTRVGVTLLIGSTPAEDSAALVIEPGKEPGKPDS